MSVIDELTDDLSQTSISIEQENISSQSEREKQLTKIEVPDSIRKKTEKLLDLMRLKGEDIELRSIEYRFARESMVTFFGAETPHIHKLTRNPSEHNKKIIRKYIIPEIDKKIEEAKTDIDNYIRTALVGMVDDILAKIRARQSEIRCMDLIHRLDALRNIKVLDTGLYKEVSILQEGQSLDALMTKIVTGRYYKIQDRLPVLFDYITTNFYSIQETMGAYITMSLNTIVFKLEQFANDTHIFLSYKDMYSVQAYVDYLNVFVDNYNTFSDEFLSIIDRLTQAK